MPYHFLSFSLLVISLFLTGRSEAQTPHTLIEGEKGAFALISQFNEDQFSGDYDLTYQRMEWNIDPAVKYISGTITSRFTVLSDHFPAIHFDLANNMQVNAVEYHGEFVDFEHLPDAVLRITLPQPLTAGATDSISVSYEGEPVSNGFGNFLTGTHAGKPVLWSFSVPYGALEWWPCKQSLDDKIDSIDVFITTAAEYKAASNGKLVEIIEGDASIIHHWQHKHPIATYLVCLAVTNYAEYSEYVYLESGDSIEILNYVYPENLAAAKAQTVHLKGVMELYNDLLGLYPYADEKYGHAQFGFGGGMEHQTMSFVGTFNYSLLAHELAHQWFGDKVTYGSWRDAWLSEGFATYLAGVVNEYLGNAADWRQWKINQIYNVTLSPGGSVWVDDTTSVNRIFDGRLTYDKGSMLVHMLRWVLGDEDFYQALRNYLDDPELAYSFARTEDLQQHLEDVSGRDMDDFFEDWFYGQGYPSYQVYAGISGSSASLRIEQTTSHNSVDFFEMPVPLLFSGEGKDSLVRLEHNFNGQEFNINLSFAIEDIRFDPDFLILSKNNTVEISSSVDEAVRERIRIYPNPAGRKLTMESDRPLQRMVLYDATGIRVREMTQDSTKYELYTRGLAPGIYMLEIGLEGKKITRQVVIEGRL